MDGPIVMLRCGRKAGIARVKFELKPGDLIENQIRDKMPAQFRGPGDSVWIIVGGVFFVIGLGLLTGAYFAGRRQYNILKHWPRVNATVTKSEVTTGRDRDITIYGTEFEFRYAVNDKEYKTPATSSYKTSSYTEMKRQADIFAPGTTHALLYDPADPNEIRYDAGYNFSFFLAPVILGGLGVVFAGVGGLVWVFFR